jgi:Mn2+/Fe2+ NRAMP family transporter
MWCAAITSVVGASYTTISFFKTLNPVLEKQSRVLVTGFIVTSTIIFVMVGNPVQLLIIAGAVNGLILPIALAVVLVAATNIKLIGDYRHPLWMQVASTTFLKYLH